MREYLIKTSLKSLITDDKNNLINLEKASIKKLFLFVEHKSAMVEQLFVNCYTNIINTHINCGTAAPLA